MSEPKLQPANAKRSYRISRADLPLCCPTKEMVLWNSHPRVYLPITKMKDGRIICPYCGTEYILSD